MRIYLHPFIKIIPSKTFFVKLQGSAATQIPDCSSDDLSCGNTVDLGSVCSLNQGAEQGRTFFFLPNSNLHNNPDCLMILNDTSPDNCFVAPVQGEDCEDGALWEITCAYPDGTCIFIFTGPSANTFEISCEGFEEDIACDTLGSPV